MIFKNCFNSKHLYRSNKTPIFVSTLLLAEVTLCMPPIRLTSLCSKS